MKVHHINQDKVFCSVLALLRRIGDGQHCREKVTPLRFEIRANFLGINRGVFLISFFMYTGNKLDN